MQRPIKYRQIKGGRVHYWGYIEDMGFVTPMASAEWHDIPSDQFTGLHDKNGKEIYEGDILAQAYRDNLAVQWNSGVSGWNIRSTLYKEVIGNIYENPELLKK